MSADSYYASNSKNINSFILHGYHVFIKNDKLFYRYMNEDNSSKGIINGGKWLSNKLPRPYFKMIMLGR